MDTYRHVYLIDDDDIILYLSNRLLSKETFCSRTSSFSDAEAALRVLKAHQADSALLPDLILLDLNMPGMSGWQFLDAFRQLNLQIPVWILTSSIDPYDKKLSETYREVKGFLLKPLRKPNLDTMRPQSA